MPIQLKVGKYYKNILDETKHIVRYSSVSDMFYDEENTSYVCNGMPVNRSVKDYRLIVEIIANVKREPTDKEIEEVGKNWHKAQDDNWTTMDLWKGAINWYKQFKQDQQ